MMGHASCALLACCSINRKKVCLFFWSRIVGAECYFYERIGFGRLVGVESLIIRTINPIIATNATSRRSEARQWQKLGRSVLKVTRP